MEIISRYGSLSYLCFTSSKILREIFSFFFIENNILGSNKKFYFKSIKESIKISSLRRILKSRECEMSGNFLRVSNHAEMTLWSISLFDYKAMENTKTFLTAVRRIPRCVHFTRQSIRPNESPSKKRGKKNEDPDFSHFIFPTFVKMIFFFSNGSDFSHRWKKTILIPCEERIYKCCESLLEGDPGTIACKNFRCACANLKAFAFCQLWSKQESESNRIISNY